MVLAAVKQQEASPQRCPALERYGSKLWELRCTYAAAFGIDTYVLSPKYGLIEWQRPIPPDNISFEKMASSPILEDRWMRQVRSVVKGLGIRDLEFHGSQRALSLLEKSLEGMDGEIHVPYPPGGAAQQMKWYRHIISG